MIGAIKRYGQWWRDIITPRHACASKGLCDRSCPFIFIYQFVTIKNTSSRIIGNY